MRAWKFLFAIGCFSLLAPTVFAYPKLTLRYKHHLFTLDPDSYPEWRGTKEIWTYDGQEILPPAEFRVDGDRIPALPPNVIRTLRPAWDISAIAATVRRVAGSALKREPRDVVIRKSSTGSIVFDGVGALGRVVDLRRSAELIAEALESGMTDIALVVEETQPSITVDDPELRALSIREIVTVGESNFAGSPIPRRHNIGIGLSKFNGHLIPKNTVFSFNDVLGQVDARAGYWKELVIMGEHTLPEYGGGLCQVSTTAYRGVWEYGFPITGRRNHSFAVSYYAPHGTDATIYPPHTDMKFLNDSPGALLLQTYHENDRAYFIYYGTKDDRTAEVIGPYTWDFRPPPPDRTDYTTEIPAGTSRKAGEQHPGLKAQWFRIVKMPGTEEKIESVYSAYEARPFITQIGVVSTGARIEVPTWLGPEWDEERATR
ncbi:MAG: VanW family protein [Patescibacteria group bacterium]